MSKALVVLWESYRDSEPSSVLVADNERQARVIANGLRASRRRRVDVVTLNGDTLRNITAR